MENARIAIFEDREIVRNFLKYLVETKNHQVIAEIASIEQAREFIDSPEASLTDVALVDGNLISQEAKSTGYHGGEITRRLKSTLPGVKVIGISASGPIEGADKSFIKPDLDGLLGYIDNLPERKTE